MTAPVRLSVAAPAYNEAAGIAAAVTGWSDFLRAHPAVGEWEIVVCDDGSRDGTGEILAGLAERIPELRVVGFAGNRGAGAAIAEAVRCTRLDWVLLTDSDGQYPIANLDRMLAARAAGGRAFSGARRRKADALAYRAGSWASGAVCNLLHGTRYRDFNSVFKLVEGPLFRSLPLESEGMNCSTEITSRVVGADCDGVEAPVERPPRGTGARSWRFLRGAAHRLLFVGYLGVRQVLLRRRVLRRPAAPGTAVLEEARGT
jgi:glycosyltransferase involved in cell wall biosynthesis